MGRAGGAEVFLVEPEPQSWEEGAGGPLPPVRVASVRWTDSWVSTRKMGWEEWTFTSTHSASPGVSWGKAVRPSVQMIGHDEQVKVFPPETFASRAGGTPCPQGAWAQAHTVSLRSRGRQRLKGARGAGGRRV